MLTWRQGLSNEQVESASQQVSRRLLDLKEINSAEVVLLYRAFRNEINLDPLFSAFWQAGKQCLVPRVEQGELCIKQVNSLQTDFEAGSFGVLEPLASLPEADLARVQVVLVPGCGFDRLGYRLGWGKGFYDRLLVRLPQNCLRIGVGYEGQVVEELPCDAWDQRLDGLVTEGEHKVRRLP